MNKRLAVSRGTAQELRSSAGIKKALENSSASGSITLCHKLTHGENHFPVSTSGGKVRSLMI